RLQAERLRLATPHLGLIARFGRLARGVPPRLRVWGWGSGRRLDARFVARFGTPRLAARFMAGLVPWLHPARLVTAWLDLARLLLARLLAAGCDDSWLVASGFDLGLVGPRKDHRTIRRTIIGRTIGPVTTALAAIVVPVVATTIAVIPTIVATTIAIIPTIVAGAAVIARPIVTIPHAGRRNDAEPTEIAARYTTTSVVVHRPL